MWAILLFTMTAIGCHRQRKCDSFIHNISDNMVIDFSLKYSLTSAWNGYGYDMAYNIINTMCF